MPKEKFEQPKEKEQSPVKEPVFATEEELAEKQQLLQALKQAETNKSLPGLEKQKEILIKLTQLDERRKQRIAGEREEGLEEVYDQDKGIFTNIRFKLGRDRGTGTSYISRHAGRPLVVLLGTQGPTAEIEPNKPYKARVEKISGKRIIYVRIIE